MRISIILALLFSAAAESQALVNTRHIYYAVTPTSPHDILSSLNSATPIRENGEPFHAYTDSFVEWKFRWKAKNGYCSISSVSVTADITFTLPKLGSAPSHVKCIWHSWYPNLLRHENNHKGHAIAIAEEIETGIANLPIEKSCALLTKNANALGHRLLERLRQMDKSYDQRTNHGETEGAWIYAHL